MQSCRESTRDVERLAVEQMGNEKYREYVADILSSSRHLLSIVEDLLNVSRLDIADENLNLEWMSAGEFIEEMVRMTRSLTSGRNFRS